MTQAEFHARAWKLANDKAGGSFSKALKRGRQHLRTPRHKEERTMNLNVEVLNPLVALIAGILILIMPRLLNYVVAIYLIVIGILGFSHHFHI
jgi:Protein of unknown function (DUF3096)